MKYNKMSRYKACRNSIVTLELLEDTKNNEKRYNVVNDKHAKFRCNKALVVNIVKVKTGEKMENDVSFYNDEFKYRLGEVVKTGFYKNLNVVCAGGIHYFKTKKAALSWFYNQNNNYPDGKITTWRENGQKLSEGTYKNGKQDGKWIYFTNDENIYAERTYKNGKRTYENELTKCIYGVIAIVSIFVAISSFIVYNIDL